MRKVLRNTGDADRASPVEVLFGELRYHPTLLRLRQGPPLILSGRGSPPRVHPPAQRLVHALKGLRGARGRYLGGGRFPVRALHSRSIAGRRGPGREGRRRTATGRSARA